MVNCNIKPGTIGIIRSNTIVSYLKKKRGGISNANPHKFNIGEKVVFAECDDTDGHIRCKYMHGMDFWWVAPDDVLFDELEIYAFELQLKEKQNGKKAKGR